MAYIYKVTNLVNGKMYVGNTSFDIQKRWDEHCRDAKKKRCQNRPLYVDMQKYGVANFEVEIIEKCNGEIANMREAYWIKQLGTFANGYNCTFGGKGKAFIDHDALLGTYMQTKCIKQTANDLGVSVDTVSDIINASNIQKPSRSDVAKMHGITRAVKAINNNGTVIMAFDSIRLAAEWMLREHDNLKSKNALIVNISRACKHGKKAYGLTWEYDVAT